MGDHTPLVGACVETGLHQALTDVLDGRLGLHQLTPALAGFWTIAYDQGRASRQPEIDRLQAEADRLYLRANNTPEKLREVVRLRLDEGAARYWVEWLRGEHDHREELHVLRDAA
ncbi:hypothetical protein [Rathayibacter festucae]|uniref:Uncharacterized protein n=1 Tax=Rathayibacter festucae DSM 15932 TaxID=1328866 RepID=A0A3Q9UXK8_9MICO|nr:hypothetical protein [Rathayibacter festucae]AZZ52813.1 hypothetical protein C1I64_12690 [Rathayibacter festucae DSM 15932]